MPRPLRINKILGINNGVVRMDVSTPKYPNAVAQFDEIDLPRVTKVGWYADHRIGHSKGKLYARREIRGKKERLHRVIYGFSKRDPEIDHKDNDGLNNVRSNLRVATKSQNQANVGANRNSKSGLKGVWWDKERNKWRSQILVNGKRYHLGYHVNPEAAHAAYRVAAQEHFRDFAHC